MRENDIGREVVDAAVEIHMELGPGLLETVYEVALSYELTRRGIDNERQVRIPIRWKGITFDEGFRADIVAMDKVIVEIKSKEEISRSDRKQVQTHLRLADKKLGFLLNFGAALMKDGIVRAVNGLEEF
jgi:GxxExxY protein